MGFHEDKPLDKPKLTEEALAQCGISYDARVYEEDESKNPSTALPQHVELVRESLLVINGTIHPDYKEKFLGGGSIDPSKFESVWLQCTGKKAVTKAEKTRESTAEEITIKSIKTAQLFKTLDNSEERGWTQAMVTKLFKPFAPTSIVDDEDLAKEWRLAQDLHWNEFSRWRNVDPERHDLTGPMPDITYGFPVYDSILPLPPSIKQTSWAQHFAYEPLRKFYRLTGGRLRCVPNTKLNSQSTQSVKDLRACHLLCFPWAVVEVKHGKVPLSEASFCCQQAVNATAAALDIQLSVWNTAHRQLGSERRLGVPPVVAFTCVGSEVKVWLTYIRSDDSNLKRMRCIYETDVREPWGVLSILTIIQNMKRWAFESLRNTIAACLDLVPIREEYSESEPKHRIHPGNKTLRIVPPEKYGTDPLTSPIQAPAKFAEFVRQEEPRTLGSDSRTTVVKRARKSDSSVPLQTLNIDETRSNVESYIETKEAVREPRHDSLAPTDLHGTDTGVHKHKGGDVNKVAEEKCDRHNVKAANSERDDMSEDENESESGDLSSDDGEGEAEDESSDDDEDEAGDDNTTEDEYGDEDVKDKIHDHQDGGKKIGMSATAEDVADIKQQALEALSGAAFTKLLTFRTIVDSASNRHLRLAIESCLFEDGVTRTKAHLRYELRKSQWDETHLKKLTQVKQVLNSASDGYEVTMSGTKAQPNIIKTALKDLSKDNKSRELKRIFTNLLSCYSSQHILKILKDGHLVVYDNEWAKLANEALDEIQHADPASYRQYSRAMKALSTQSRKPF